MQTTLRGSAMLVMVRFLFGCGSPASPALTPTPKPFITASDPAIAATIAVERATRAAEQTKAIVDFTRSAPTATPTPCIKERYNQPEADGAVNHIVVMCDGAFGSTPVATAVKQQLAPAQASPTSTLRPPTATAVPTATATPRPAPTNTPTTSVDHSGVPGSGFSCPAGYPYKGNASSMIYHVPGGGSYSQTKPERCFATEADAVNAGFRRARN